MNRRDDIWVTFTFLPFFVIDVSNDFCFVPLPVFFAMYIFMYSFLQKIYFFVSCGGVKPAMS